MLTIKLILFFLSFLIPGYILVSLLLKDKYPNNLFRLGLGYGLGIYFITIQIFIWIFLLNQSFNYFWFTLLVVTENLVLINFYLNKGVKRESNVLQNIANTLKKLNIRENTILLLILVQIIFIFFNALARPVMTFDSLSMWSYKAKILFYEQSIELKNTEAVNYMGGGGKLNYPWNIPLIQFWLHENLGAYNELAVNFIFLGFFLSTLIIVYFFLKEYLNNFSSLLFVFLLASMPLFFYHSYNAYADLPLSYYALSAFGFLYAFLKKESSEYLYLAAIFLGITLFTKSEGVLYLIAELVVLSIYLKVKNKSFKYWFLFLGLIAAINTPWELFRRWHDLGIMNESSLLGFYPEILPNYLTGFFATNSWNVWWYIVAIVFFINLPKIIRTDLKYLWLLLFTPVLFFMIIYLFTDAHIAVLDFTAVVRNILTLIPISVLVVGVTLGELWSNTRP